MKYMIHRQNAEAVYLQLYRQVRQDIVKGILSYGTKLPSKRILAEELSISIITVEHAYSLLCDEGYVEARQRSGYFVIFRPDHGFAEPVELVLLPPTPHKGEETEFPFSVLTKTMRRVMNDYGEAILEISPGTGCQELRDAICQYLARSRGVCVSPEQVILGSGSEHLYTLVLSLLGKDRHYAIEAPSYHKIEQVYCASGVSFSMLPLGSEGIESRALWSCEGDVLHISPYRSYPSGVTASASKRHEYLCWVSKGERYIIEDDFQSEFSLSRTPEDTLFSQSDGERVIYMNSFSKTISPSLRVAYMVLPQTLVPLYRDRLGFLSCTVPTFQQLVLASLLRGGEFERHINRVRRKIRKSLTTE